MASNRHGTSTEGSTCRRYIREERKYIQLPFPKLCQAYNAGIGGVNTLDNTVACYRVPVPYRKKKWWFAVYTWSLSVQAVNAWKLRVKTTGKKEPYLAFIRELVVEMLTRHGSSEQAIRVPVRLISDSIRFDGFNHWPVSTAEDKNGKSSRRNCKFCSLQGKPDRKASLQCDKCQVALHIHCFKGRIHFNLKKAILLS